MIKRISTIAIAIAIATLADGRIACAQDAPPLPWRVDPPDSIEAVLRPIAGNPDAEIVRAYFAQNDARIRNRAGTRNLAYDPEKSYVGRSRIAPGAEPQILILLTGTDDCWNGSCAGYAIEKVGDEWVELTDLRGFVDGGFGFVSLAAEPILARLRNAVTLENDTTATIEPVNDGRRTLIWYDRGYSWNGNGWRLFCWREPCD